MKIARFKNPTIETIEKDKYQAWIHFRDNFFYANAYNRDMVEIREKYKDEILKNQGRIPLIIKYEDSIKVECDDDFYTKMLSTKALMMIL